MENINSQTIALIGGGPAALLVLKNMTDGSVAAKTIYVFEKNARLGVGMPYGNLGAGREHVANVSANELPKFEISFEEYLSHNRTNEFPDFSVDGKCNPFQVIPRLLLGNYLEFTFKYYSKEAKKKGIKVITKTNSTVDDIIKIKDGKQFKIIVNQTEEYVADKVILCTGHYWPKKHEEKVIGWYDSPYPPSKFQLYSNHPIAIRGTSLTAVDAVKTHSRLNGKYETMPDGQLKYTLNEGCENFRIDMFSTGGFLPALRFHSEDAAYSNEWTMSLEEIYEYKQSHNGFVDLDYIFEINFKNPLKQKDPAFYDKIKNLSIEEFVTEMMSIRKELDSFQLFKAEYNEAEKSIRRHQSISWKEALRS